MSRLTRVDQLTAPPVVGRFYLVPMIYFLGWNYSAWWPVMGPQHEDAEHLNYPHEHYHVDIRFCSRRLVQAMRRYDSRTLGLIAGAQPIVNRTLLLPTHPTFRRVECFRHNHDYPSDSAAESPAFQRLYRAYAGSQCGRGKSGWICPHRQFHLGSIQAVDGVITCPLHGLRFNAETGVCLGSEKVAA